LQCGVQTENFFLHFVVSSVPRQCGLLTSELWNCQQNNFCHTLDVRN